MSNAPLVSVITATYNWSRVLRLAIQSVLGQSLQDFEMIVVGDGCTDDSADAVASFGDKRLRWHNLPQNSGSQSAPNNAGIELARGRYVAYLGHDDLWYPTHLELLSNALEQTGADLAHSLLVNLGPPDTGVRVLYGLPLTSAYEEYVFSPPSCWMHRRALIQEIGGWKDYRTIQTPPDRDFLERVWAADKRVIHVNDLTVFKFQSFWRRNSYIEKPCHEQAEYLRRIQEEPDFLYREVLEIAAASILKKPTWPPNIPRPSNDKSAGATVRHFRWLRGLEEKPASDDRELEFSQAFDRAEVLFGPRDLFIRAENDDPQVVLPPFDFKNCHRLLVRIDITSPDQTWLQLFYATRTTPQYTESQSVVREIHRARNLVQITLDAREIVDALRLDPGCHPGDYTIHSLEIRGDHVQPGGAAK